MVKNGVKILIHEQEKEEASFPGVFIQQKAETAFDPSGEAFKAKEHQLISLPPSQRVQTPR